MARQGACDGILLPNQVGGVTHLPHALKFSDAAGAPIERDAFFLARATRRFPGSVTVAPAHAHCVLASATAFQSPARDADLSHHGERSLHRPASECQRDGECGSERNAQQTADHWDICTVCDACCFLTPRASCKARLINASAASIGNGALSASAIVSQQTCGAATCETRAPRRPQAPAGRAR